MTGIERIIQQIQIVLADLGQRVRRLETREVPLSVTGSGSVGAESVGAAAVTLLPAGSAMYVITMVYVVREITGGGTSGGTVTLNAGSGFSIYNDGTDVLTLALSALGALTAQRTAGADTFDVKLMGVWL